MRTDPESDFSRPMMSLSNTLLPVPLRPNNERGSPRFTLRLIPFKTFWLPEDLCKTSTPTAGALPTSCASPRSVAILSIVFILVSRFFHRWSWEKQDNDLYQHHIGEDHEQRRQDHRTRGRATHAHGTPLCPHSLETRNQPNDQSKHSGLKRRWQEIVKIGAAKTGIDELM